MSIYGYARVSTLKQSIERQLKNIKREFPEAYIVSEKFTGTTTDRPEWNKLQRALKEGDTVVFDSVSRMSRNADEGAELYFKLFEQGITLVFLNEPYINTDIYRKEQSDKLEMTGTIEDCIFRGLNEYFREIAKRQIMIAFEQAQKERDDLSQRIKEGIAVKKARCTIEGMPFEHGMKSGSKIETQKSKKMKEEIRRISKSFDGSLNDVDAMKFTGLARNTFYKYKREMKIHDVQTERNNGI